MGKQVFNYGLINIDRCNQITNVSGYSRADIVFPGSFDKSELYKTIEGYIASGFCYSVDLCSPEDDEDIRFRVHFANSEQYKRFVQELFFRDLLPIGIAYIPSREEVGL